MHPKANQFVHNSCTGMSAVVRACAWISKCNFFFNKTFSHCSKDRCASRSVDQDLPKGGKESSELPVWKMPFFILAFVVKFRINQLFNPLYVRWELRSSVDLLTDQRYMKPGMRGREQAFLWLQGRLSCNVSIFIGSLKPTFPWRNGQINS